MKYDFAKVCDRTRTDCVKWDAAPAIFGRKDVIPMWVADMDFPVAPPIVEALKKRIGHEFYGYTLPGGAVIDSVVERMKRKFNWKIERDWVVLTPGVVPALHAAVKALTHPGDEIILQEPVYFPFFSAVTSNGCRISNNELKFIDGRYEMDYAGLENKFREQPGPLPAPNRVKGIIFCNPHNPIGRVWNKEEVTRMGEIVIRHGGTVISDEIHCEILFKGNTHTPFGAISEEFEQNCIVCMAPSKTFNLAGLEASSIIIPNKKLRDGFAAARMGILPEPNLFGLTAMEAAYRLGDEWLEQLLDYLQVNLDFAIAYFETRIPKIKSVRPEGTYLVWLDCRALGMDDTGLRSFMREKASVGLDDGFLFGAAGAGFQRMNIACPGSILKDALGRIEKAVNSL